MIRTLIVDDVALARQGIRARLEHEHDIEIVGEASSGADAVAAINALHPDLVFLDVQMPGMEGFEVLERTAPEHVPAVIFVTAHEHYAVQAFDAEALDYLLKPVSTARFQEALQRARRELADEHHREEVIRRVLDVVQGRSQAPAAGAVESKESSVSRLVVRDRERFLLIKTDDVDWIASAGNYAEVHVRGRALMLRMTMAQLEERLHPDRFVRIHRSTIVNVDRVQEIRTPWPEDFEVVLEDGTTLRMSKRYRMRLIP